MTPYYADESVTVYAGDCLDILPTLPDGSVDAVVTDPPYDLTNRTPDVLGCEECGRTLGGRDGMPDICPRCGGALSRQRSRQRRGFMGREWDGTGIAFRPEAWQQCLRVLKPGGYLLAFGGSRTYHRLTCAIEDAGFEVRDCITWIYGSGFAKSWNFSTQFDGPWCECPSGNAVPYSHARDPGVFRVRRDVQPSSLSRREGEDAGLFPAVQREAARTGVGEARSQGAGGVVAGERSGSARADDRRDESGMDGRVVHRAGQGLSDGTQARPSEGTGERIRGRAPSGDGGDDRPRGDGDRGSSSHQPRPGGQPARELAPLSRPHDALDDGALRGRSTCPRCGGLRPEFRGFGTGLKPAHEPVVVARKPLAGTVAGNVVAHGVGALNIDATRVATLDTLQGSGRAPLAFGGANHRPYHDGEPRPAVQHDAGRWPSNVVLSHPPRYDTDGNVVDDGCAAGCVDGCPVAELDRQSGIGPSNFSRDKGPGLGYNGGGTGTGGPRGHDDVGGASRFFPTFRYEAKADSFERPRDGGTAHPTVKPVDLMRWLVRLVTPPGGLILDPFGGSGTTAEACFVEGFRCVIIEKSAEYLPLIMARLSKPLQPTLSMDVGGL